MKKRYCLSKKNINKRKLKQPLFFATLSKSNYFPQSKVASRNFESASLDDNLYSFPLSANKAYKNHNIPFSFKRIKLAK